PTGSSATGADVRHPARPHHCRQASSADSRAPASATIRPQQGHESGGDDRAHGADRTSAENRHPERPPLSPALAQTQREDRAEHSERGQAGAEDPDARRLCLALLDEGSADPVGRESEKQHVSGHRVRYRADDGDDRGDETPPPRTRARGPPRQLRRTTAVGAAAAGPSPEFDGRHEQDEDAAELPESVQRRDAEHGRHELPDPDSALGNVPERAGDEEDGDTSHGHERPVVSDEDETEAADQYRAGRESGGESARRGDQEPPDRNQHEARARNDDG